MDAWTTARRELARFRARLSMSSLRREFRGARGLQVAIGDPTATDGAWIRLALPDASATEHACDFRKALPFEDGSVRTLRCGEAFEAIDYTEELPYFLSECRRVLEAGGMLRIRVRDAARFVEAYRSSPGDENRSLRVLAGTADDRSTRMELFNASFRDANRRSALYDLETLEFLLRRFGFRDPRRVEAEDPAALAVEALS